MTIKEFIAKVLSIAPDDQKAELERLSKEVDDNPAPAPAGAPPDIEALVRTAVEKATGPLNEKITLLQGALTKAAADNESASRALEEQRKAERDAKVRAAVDAGVAAGQIPAKNDDALAKWSKMFEVDYAAAEFALAQVPKTTTGTGQKSDDKAGAAPRTEPPGRTTMSDLLNRAAQEQNDAVAAMSYNRN